MNFGALLILTSYCQQYKVNDRNGVSIASGLVKNFSITSSMKPAFY